jgi:hypothetical protein
MSGNPLAMSDCMIYAAKENAEQRTWRNTHNDKKQKEAWAPQQKTP